MWISLFDIKRDVSSFGDKFEQSEMKKALAKFGNFTFEWNYGITSRFLFNFSGREITFRFFYSFKDRKMEVDIWDTGFEDIGQPKYGYNDPYSFSRTKIHDGFEEIHVVMFNEFKKWLSSIELDCMIHLPRVGCIVPDEECFRLSSTRSMETFTYSGEESKQIVTLMKEIPVTHNVSDKSTISFTKIGKVFSGASIMVNYSFYPRPSVDFIYGDHEFCYQEDLLDVYTLKRCFSVQDIMEFYLWCEGFRANTKDAMEKLLDKVQEISSAEMDISLEDGSVFTGDLNEFTILPVVSNFDFKYDVFSANLDEATVDTVDEAMELCLLDLKTQYELRDAGKEIMDFVSTFQPEYISRQTTKSRVSSSMRLFGKAISWSISFQFETKTNKVSYHTQFDLFNTLQKKDVDGFVSAIEMLKKEIGTFVKQNRIRSVFEDKSKTMAGE